MKYAFIVNPASGNGKGATRVREELKAYETDNLRIYCAVSVAAHHKSLHVWCKALLQGGMNSKVWEAGIWEREVTVRGDKLF